MNSKALTSTATHRLAILGDLHYEAKEKNNFETARQQIIKLKPHHLISLGDVGGYSYSGSQKSFEDAKSFFSTFKVPFYPLIGNHDMEGKEFKTDAESVEAWCHTFSQPLPYYSIQLEHALLIFLSSTRYRSNQGSCHEVHLEEEQVQWFQAEIEAHPNTPIIVFSHCPILGSQLRVLQNLHLKVPNAYLNHTDRPQRFFHLLKKNPQIKLWFSGHNHLGQNYSDSVTQVDSCTFVHTGVIGSVSRDGHHQSRFLELNEKGYTLFSVDHDTGNTSKDVVHTYNKTWKRFLALESPTNPRFFPPLPFPSKEVFLQLNKSVFLIYQEMLVEYDKETQAPLGVVREALGQSIPIIEGNQLILVTSKKRIIIQPNSEGRYYKVFFPNPDLPKSSA